MPWKFSFMTFDAGCQTLTLLIKYLVRFMNTFEIKFRWCETRVNQMLIKLACQT